MNSKEKPQATATRRQVIAGLTVGAATVGTAGAARNAVESINRSRESILQEVEFKVPPERLYAALTDEKQFQKVVLLSAAMQSGKVKEAPPARIAVAAGGGFSIFGGFVSGRQIELIPNMRIVQAWRPADWPAGVYSIARFDLVGQGAGTLLRFEQIGFPQGQAEHLAQGWRLNYWEPLEKSL